MGITEHKKIEDTISEYTAEKQLDHSDPSDIQTIMGTEVNLAAVMPEQNQNDRKEEVIMPEEPPIEMTRKQIYDEIWEISVAGVAKKYNIQYTWLMKQVKEADIPIPPSGYWAKLSVGKPVTKPELTEPVSGIVLITKTMPTSRKRKVSGKTQPVKKEDKILSETKNEPTISEANVIVDEPVDQEILTADASLMNSETTDEQPLVEPKIFEQYGKTYNVYDRETLYKEVWEMPVTEVAKRYKVSDVAIHKVCKSLNIPSPPLGYWAKLRAEKPVSIIPLPDDGRVKAKTGLRTEIGYNTLTDEEILEFLSPEDRGIILAVSSQIILPDENAKMHPKIIAHRKTVVEWKRIHKADETKSWSMRNAGTPPFLADTVSEETLPRVYRIIDALIKAMEPLGCSLTNDLKFVVNGETVAFTVSEAKDEIKHVLTKEENMQLLKYEEEKRRYSYASKPNIRKYDRPYNGHISLTVYKQKTLRDCKSYVIEDKLGDIMIGLYEAADVIRKEREAREEAERKRKEEERLREGRRKRFNKEVDRTLNLTNLAEDYDIACKIRRYVAAVEATGKIDENKLAWIEWANNKADWYDPTIARDDEFLGKREHTKDKEKKELKRPGWWDLE